MSLESSRSDLGNMIEKNIPLEPISLERSETEEVPESFEAKVFENIQSISFSRDTFNSDTEVLLNLARNSAGPEVETDQVENDTGVCAELASLDTKANEYAGDAVSRLSEHAEVQGVPKRNIANLLKPFRNVAAAAMIALSMPAQDLEAKEGNLPSYNKGKIELNSEAWKSPSEISRIYVEKNGVGKWSENKNGGGTFAGYDFKYIDAAIASHPDKIELDHIHPLKMLNDLYQNESSKGPLSKLEHPPSFLDFHSAYRISNYISGRSPQTKVGFGVVDHNGSWKYSIDPESKFFKTVSLFQDRLFGEIGKISNENPHFKKRLLDSLGGKEGIDPRLVGNEIFEQILDPKYSLYHTLSDSERLEIQNIISSGPQSKDFEEMQIIEMSGIFPKYQSSSYLKNDKEKEEVVAKQKKAIKKYIKYGKKLGINMEFTPIEEFKK